MDSLPLQTLAWLCLRRMRNPRDREDAGLFGDVSGTRRPERRLLRLGWPEAWSWRPALGRALCPRAAGREGRRPGPRAGPAPPGAQSGAEALRARAWRKQAGARAGRAGDTRGRGRCAAPSLQETERAVGSVAGGGNRGGGEAWAPRRRHARPLCAAPRRAASLCAPLKVRF